MFRGRRLNPKLSALVVGAWSVMAALNVAAELSVQYRILHADRYLAIAVSTALPWYVWALATPLVAWAARRWPIGRPVSSSAVVSHAVLAISIALAFVTATFWLDRVARPIPPAGGWLGSFEAWFPFQLLIYVMVSGLAHAARFARRAREEAMHRAVLSEQLTRAQLDALRARLHPHFLFNTLNTISMLVRDHDSRTAVRLIAELGALLRELLQSDAADEVTLAHELAFVERYLAIEQMRFGDRLRVERDIEPEALNSVVPSLVLQPLVENALRHGLDRGSGHGTVRIGARVDGSELHVLVFDCKSRELAGVMNQDTDADAACGFGLGLSTTRERLQRLHGERAQLRVTHSVAGTCAMLTLPRRIAASA